MAADGTIIALAQGQGGIMAQSNTATNIRHFPKVESVSTLNEFLVKIGAKEMVASTKKDESATSTAIKWNQSVVGLIATLLTVLGMFAAVLVSYVTLSVNFTNYQKATDEKMIEMKQKLDKIEDWQRQDSLQKAKIDGYKAGTIDAHDSNKKEEKK